MGDSFAASSPNVVSTAVTHGLPQPALSLVNEDDDEPPSSGPNTSRTTQVDDTSRDGGSGSSHSPPAVVVGRDGVYNDVSTEKDSHVDIESTKSSVVHIQLGERQETLVDSASKQDVAGPGDLEQGRHGVVRQRRREPRTTIFGVKFDSGRHTRKLRTLFTPTRVLGPMPTYRESLKAALRYTPLNVLLLFIPVSWALHFTHQSPTLIFVFSALGLVPLAALLGFGTEQIALKTSASVGGLLNATLGNIVEMIIAGIALKEVSGVSIFSPSARKPNIT